MLPMFRTVQEYNCSTCRLTQQRPCIVPKTLSRENRDQYALTVDTAPSEAVELPKLIDCDLDYISEPLVRPEIR